MTMTGYQAGFASGILAPSLYGRIDLARYPLGAADILNAYVRRQGGVCNRTGFRYTGPVGTHSDAARLIPFSFNTEQTYILVLQDEVMYVVRDNGFVLESTDSITGISQASQGVVTSSGHSLSNGDLCYISSVSGMVEINNLFATVSDSTASTFKLKDPEGNYIDTSGFTAYSSGGSAGKVYSVATPWDKTDLFELKFAQSADVMTVTHRDYPIYEISRTGDASWAVAVPTLATTATAPSNLTTDNAPGTTSRDFTYKVTAIDANGHESLPATADGDADTITGITRANPGVVTITTSNLFNIGDEILITGVVGMTEVNGNRYRIRTVASTTTYTLETLDGEVVDTSGFTTYSSGGSMIPCFLRDQFAADRSEDAGTIKWDPVAGAEFYRVYLAGAGQKAASPPKATSAFGLIGETTSAVWTDPNIQTDLGDQPPIPIEIFDETDTYPDAVTYHEQRRVFANSNNSPQTFWLSQTGRSANFNKSQPLKDDDALEFTYNLGEVNEIRHVLSFNGNLMLLTSGAEILADSGANPISASNVPKMNPQSSNGIAANVRPLIVNDTVLYVDASGRQIRDLRYLFETDAFAGGDLSVMAEHLFGEEGDAKTVIDWCYAKRPDSIVWMVMSDGTMLSLTYLREHDVVAFARHSTDGAFEAVASIREGNEDVVYAVVNRTIGGNTRRYIERLHERDHSSIEDAFFVDSGATYGGSETTTFYGMHHLAGETVVGLADGEPFSGVTVAADGSVTLGAAATDVQVGLAYTSDLETLPIGAVEVQGRNHKIENAFVRVYKSRDIKVGYAADTSTLKMVDDPHEVIATPKEVQSKIYKMPIQSDWAREGGILIRQASPLPFTILSVTLDVATGR